MTLRVDVWHNILWSKYKGGVFSELNRLCVQKGVDIRFFQIAETENDRRALGAVDPLYHKYPYRLIAKGSYQDIPLPRLIATLFWLTLTSRADVVVLAGYHKIEYWAQLLAARLTRKTVMVFCDSTALDRPRQKIKDFLKRQFFARCDGFFCYGQRSREYLLSYGVPTDRTFIRCQAAALPHDYDPAAALRQRLERQSEARPPVILYVGRLSPEKNLPRLLQAFRAVATDRPACQLRLVGEGPDRAALEAAAASLGIGSQVTFAGGMSGAALYDEYVGATCLVLPSLSEPWGLVVNEALSYGCPVVVSDNCGCVPELVIEGVTGFTFAATEVDDLGRSLLRALAPGISEAERAKGRIELIAQFRPENAAGAILAGILQVR